MGRRLLFLSLFALPLCAAMPALVCAQQTKLVNCRNLEDAGNFVGPDEVIVDDMVCRKVKVGSQLNGTPAALKPLPGAVVSDTDSVSVVDAAKAASKRVSAAKDAIREKNAQPSEPVTPTTPANAPAEPSSTPSAPAPAPEPAKAPVTTPPPAKAPVILPVKPPHTEIAATPAPPEQENSAPAAAQNPPASTNNPAPAAKESVKEEITEPAAAAAVSSFTSAVEKITNRIPEPAPEPKAEVSATAAPVPAKAAATSPETNSVTPAPTTAASETPVNSPPPVQPAAIAEPAPTPAVTNSSAVAEAPKSAEAPAPAASATGFVDANVGAKVMTNPRPEDTSTERVPQVRSPEPGSSQPVVAAKAAPRPVDPEAAARAAVEARERKIAQEEAAASLVAPDPNLGREKVVAVDTFKEPHEVGPDPSELAHKTTFQPGDIEGFEEGHRAECTKNVTMAGLKGQKLVLGTPAWATKWIERNQKRMPQVCFSETPMTTAKNYLIVFYTAPANEDASAAGAALQSASATQEKPAGGGIGAFTLNYGSTWHYAKDATVGVTVLTHDEADEPQSQFGKVWYATAYTAEGLPFSEHWPGQLKKQIKIDPKNAKTKKAREARSEIDHVADELLNELVEDIQKL